MSVHAVRLARDVGVTIARQITAGGSEVRLRLDPAEFGRIDVRMSFDDQGALRAVVSADSSTVLDVLRRDSADLGRAMTDAGVRADAQSFRFEGNGSDSRNAGDGQPRGQRQQQSHSRNQPETDSTADFKPLNWNGRLDVTA